MRALPLAALSLLSVALPLGGCGFGADDAEIDIIVVGNGASGTPRSGDKSYLGQLVSAATAEGLVGFDAQGRVIPALADRWIVLDDGQSYIFRLRDGTWKSGEPLSAQSARTALRDAVAALKGSSLALDLAVIDDIRVMAGRVIEIRLGQPMPDLLQLLAQPELGLVHRKRDAGPMLLTRTEEEARLVPIDPERLGLPAVEDWAKRTRSLTLAAASGADAVQRFSRGEADLLLGGRAQHFPLTGTLGISRGTIRLDPVTGLFGLAVMNADGFLASAGNREALALTIDRIALIQVFAVQGWVATTRVVPAAIVDPSGVVVERWSNLDMEERRNRARAVVERWRAANGNAAAPPLLRIALPEGPGADLIFDRLRTDFGAIGLALVRVGESKSADLTLIDEVARYPRAPWFLNRLNCGVQRGLCDEGADALMTQVRIALDPETRSRLLREAEASLTAANVFIPLGAPLRWSLVRGDLTGFATNPTGWHPLMPMALKPK